MSTIANTTPAVAYTTSPAHATHEEGVFRGKMVIRQVTGKRGAFNVAKIITALGEFAVIQRELDQFDVGNYVGRFHVEIIKLRHFMIGGASLSEIQAVLRSFIIAPFDNATGEIGEPVEVVSSAAAPAGQKPAAKAKATATATAPKPAQTPMPAPAVPAAAKAEAPAPAAPKAAAEEAKAAPAAPATPAAAPDGAFAPRRHRLIPTDDGSVVGVEVDAKGNEVAAPVASAADAQPAAPAHTVMTATLVPTRNADGGITYVAVKTDEVSVPATPVAGQPVAPAPAAPKAASSGVATFVFGRDQLSGAGKAAEQVVAETIKAAFVPAPVAPAAEPAKTVMTVAEEMAFRQALMDKELFGEEIYTLIANGAAVIRLDATVGRPRFPNQAKRLGRAGLGYVFQPAQQEWHKAA